MARVRVGDVVVDLEGGVVWGHDGKVDLLPLEHRLLSHLVARSPAVVTREELLEEVWGYAPTVQTRTVDNTVGRLRRKVDPAIPPRHLLTIRGQGFQLHDCVPVIEPSADPAVVAPIVEAITAGRRLVVLSGPPGDLRTATALAVATGLGSFCAVAGLEQLPDGGNVAYPDADGLAPSDLEALIAWLERHPCAVIVLGRSAPLGIHSETVVDLPGGEAS